MSNLLIKTSESSVKQDKNGRNYKSVIFTEVVMMNTPFGVIQKPVNQSISTSINCYESRYLDDKMDIGYSDPIFNAKTPQNGGVFQGSIETRQVAEYDITDKEGNTRAVSSYKTIVFGDTTSPNYQSLVAQAFKSRGPEVLEAAPSMAASTQEVF
jgi:hypothetical protein